MEDGGCRRWQDDVEPDLRPRMIERIMVSLERNLKTFPNERLQKYVAKVEMDTFRAANSKMEYMRMMSSHATRFQKPAQPHKAAAHRQQEMHMGHPIQLDNTMQATQGGNSSFTATIPQTTPMMANPAGSPFQSQNQHMASPFVPNMQVNVNQIPSDMIGMLYQNFNPQPAMVVPLEQSVQSCQQVMQPIGMQSHSQRPAMQRQPTNITQFHQASIAQLEGHPIAWPNDGYNDHLHRQNDCAYAQHLQPTVQQQQFGITPQHVGMQSYQMLGANVGKMNDGYFGGWNNHQNAGWASGIQSPECEQVVLKKQTNMESELVPPAPRQITVNQQSSVHCRNPQYQARMESDGEVDWREEMVQQIKSLKDAYFLELMELDQIIVVHRLTEEQFKLLPREKAYRYNHMLRTKSCISDVLKFLQLEKSIGETYRGKLPRYEKVIRHLLSWHRKRKANAQMSTGQESMICPRQPPPQTINLTADIAPFTSGKSDRQKLLADESIGRMRQNVVTTPSAGQKTSNQLQGVTSPRFSIKSRGVSQSSPINEVGLFCKLSPIDKLEVASPNALLKSRSQSSVAKLGVIEDPSPTVSLSSTLTLTVEKSGFLEAASSCASLKSASPSDIEKSGIIPVVSPSDRGSSLLHNNTEVNGCNQTTPTKLLTPDPPSQTQTPAEHGGTETRVAKKPIDRLIAAVRSSSPVVLCSSVNLMKSVLREMDSVPLRTGYNNKIKRIYDVTPPSESPSVSSMDGSIVTFELDASDSASSRYGSVKRQKTQNTRVALLDEIEAVNNRLIDTEIIITSDDREGGSTSCRGVTMVKLSYTAVSLAPSLKSQLATSGNLQPLMMPMTLLIPADYPRSSPVIMDDEGDAQLRTKFSCISVGVDSSFRLALRSLKEPRSLKETAMVWDSCVRRAVMEYAYQLGGGTLTMSLGCREGWVAA